ncbi:MAG TPA: chalcone isomerase family protein [Candidatus Bathyarchaeia archaeon]|nr:chalcone isomerase family protein [Candidatus Bathyarchaeia archaeon]
MRRVLLALSLVTVVWIATLALHAASLAGVTLPDSQQVAGKSLVLNGLGLRTKMFVKVYVAGLYLEQKSSDASAIMKSDSAKRIVMHFLYHPSKSQMVDAFKEGFQDNAPDAVKSIEPDLNKLYGALQDLKAGDEMVFTYVPATGTTLAINGQDKLTIAGEPFEQALLSVWLGPKPPTADVKKGMLGH